MALKGRIVAVRPSRRTARPSLRPSRRAGVYASVLAATLIVWSVVAAFSSPFFFPSPMATLDAAVNLTRSGDLPEAIAISYTRILTGWAIGCVVAIPLAIFAARIQTVRLIVEPYINFFRFVPPIAFLGIAILWFGIGEESKIAIIVYTSTFTVFLNTLAGAVAIHPDQSRAALSLGASRRQVLRFVILPSTVPAILTGMRIGMGFSFMSVIAAELVAAEEGIGFLIYNARLFLKTENAFAGIITLGLMGLVADVVFRRIAGRLFHKHDLPF